MTKSVNPLKQYFRQPAIYLQLPSKGEFWADGSLALPETGELPVLPMTAIDEITYRTPDALFNGQAVVNVLQSCIPNVKNGWEAPAVDVNAMLIGIRIASYGHDMDVGTTCPECNTDAEVTIDLRVMLDAVKMPDYTKTIQYGDLEITFQPITYRDQNKTNQLQFEAQRQVQAITLNEVMPDAEKVIELNKALGRITELTLEALKWSIASIRTPQAMVTEPEHIQEFLQNCDRKLFMSIRDRIVEMRTNADLPPIAVKCENCGHEYEQSVQLDMASFFEAAS
jgi:RNase P subunit RPR2